MLSMPLATEGLGHWWYCEGLGHSMAITENEARQAEAKQACGCHAYVSSLADGVSCSVAAACAPLN